MEQVISHSDKTQRQPPTVGHLVAEYLELCGVKTAFGVISIHNMPILDAIGQQGNIQFVPSRGEAGAVNMADAYARVNQHVGVAFTSTGTAAGNAAGAMVEALTAGSAVLHITGQIETEHLDRNRAYIHEAPAQLDMLKAVSKSAYRISSVDEVMPIFEKAITEALTPPRGPVSIEIPIDIQATQVELSQEYCLPRIEKVRPDEVALTSIAKQLVTAKRPMMLLGGGSRHASAVATRLADMGIGIVTSTNGRAVVPENHPMSVGAFNQSTYLQTLYQSIDLFLVVGSRLRSNETWSYKMQFPENMIVVDCDPLANGRNYSNQQFVCADSELFLEGLAEKVEGQLDVDKDFVTDIGNVRQQAENDLLDDLGPYAVLVQTLQAQMPRDAVWVRDVTISNSMWGNRLLRISDPANGVHALGGGIGQGLPMAIGAAVAAGNRKVVALTGDGGLSLCLGELITAAETNVNLTIILMNDRGYGVIRNIQDAQYGSRHYYSNILTPEFCRISESLGLVHCLAKTVHQFRHELKLCLSTEGVSILEVDMQSIGTFKRSFAGPPSKD